VFVDVDFTTRFYFLFAVVIFPCIEFSFFRFLSPSFFLFFSCEEAAAKLRDFPLV